MKNVIKIAFVFVFLIGSFSAFAEDGTEENKVLIYPNPASTNVSIQVVGNTEIEFYDIVGQKLNIDLTGTRATADGKVSTFDLSSLPKGLYFIKVKYTDSHTFELHKFKKL